MNMRVKKSLGLASAAILFGGMAVTPSLFAAAPDVPVSVTITSTLGLASTTLNFGEIDYTPGGGSIAINASSATDLTTIVWQDASGLQSSDATNARNGSITITSDASFVVTAAYDDASLDAGNSTTLTVEEVASYSDTTATHTGGTPTVLYVGGKLVVPVDAEDGTYTGDIVVTLTYTP